MSKTDYLAETFIESQDRWDRFYLGLAQYYSTKSKDPSTKVGAILVDANNHVAGCGYNGFPPGVADLEERYNDRELKYKLVVHAEVNAIIDAREKSMGGTLYVYPSFALPPICNECCKVAIVAGVFQVVGYEADPNDERVKRWADSISISKLMCEEAGVLYRGIKP